MAEQDLFDQVIKETATDRPAFRQAPPGDYLVTVQSVKFVKANNGRQGIELVYTLIEPMHNEDMTGVALAKCRLSDTMWISEKSIGIVQERLARISKDVVGNTLRDVADILPGNDVVVNISHETQNRDGTALNTPRLKVERYYSVDWYMNNKRAA